MSLLYIYDPTEGPLGRYDDDGRAKTSIAAKDLDSLWDGLDKLVAERRTFDRVLWATHGGSGKISFGGREFHASMWRNEAVMKKSYHLLFPKWTTIWFSGCNVADGEYGWRFLENCGRTLLLTTGGFVMGWDSWGVATSWRLGDGRIRHYWGEKRGVWINAGVVVQRFVMSDEEKLRRSAARLVAPPMVNLFH